MSQRAWVMYLDIDPPSQNTLYGAAVKAAQIRKKRMYRDAAQRAFELERVSKDIPRAKARRRVTWERILGPRQREYDMTNFIGGLKPIEDGLVRAGLVVDDSPRHYIARWGQVTDRRDRGPALRVTLEEWPRE